MRLEHLKHLACPACRKDLTLEPGYETGDSGHITAGRLQCTGCSETYPILRSIPRFVPEANYAGNFGFEWLRHPRTQYDSYTGTTASEARFFEQTLWPRRVPGEVVLEAGSGSGRFTEQIAKTGATVVSVDYSVAVEANFQSNSDKPNVLIVQGDIRRLPVREAYFDRVVCIGVLQHTPEPHASFQSLVRHVREGGHLAIDISRWRWWTYPLDTRRWIRPFVRKASNEKLYGVCERYINAMWPLARFIHRLPKGKRINRLILVPDYRDEYPLSERVLKEWAILDLFDGLSPRYDNPQPIERVRDWFRDAGLSDVEVEPGYNGIEGRGTKPLSGRTAKPPASKGVLV